MSKILVPKTDYRVVSVRAKLSNLDDYSVSPFIRKRRKLSDEEKEVLKMRFK